MPSHSEFRFKLHSALLTQLVHDLEQLTTDPLVNLFALKLAQSPGIYQLFRENELVYTGKADKSIPERLGQHLRKISGRQNIDVQEMSFRCLFIDPDWSTSIAEDTLINRYKKKGLSLWNGSGFGMKDPGRERDSTKIAENHFDFLYPINPDIPCCGIQAGEWDARNLAKMIKTVLPFLFRYDLKALPIELRVKVPENNMTFRQLLSLLVMSLPGWQATLLQGWAILYKENEIYPSGEVIQGPKF